MKFLQLRSCWLVGLSKTYIVTTEYDPMRDDGVLYAQRLVDAGVHVTHAHYVHGFHGMLAFTQFPLTLTVGLQMMDDLILYLNETL